MSEWEWNDMPWIYSDWVPKVGLAVLIAAFAFAVIWGYDGLKKFSYWVEKKIEEEGDE